MCETSVCPSESFALEDAYDAAVRSIDTQHEYANASRLFSRLSIEREILRLCRDDDSKRELCALLEARVEAIPLITADSVESALRVNWLIESGVAASAPPRKYRRVEEKTTPLPPPPPTPTLTTTTVVYDRVRRVHEQRYGADGGDDNDPQQLPPIVSEAALLAELTLRNQRTKPLPRVDYDAVYKDVLSVRYDIRRCVLGTSMRRARDNADRRHTDELMARANRLDEEETFLHRELASAEITVRTLYRELTSRRSSNLPGDDVDVDVKTTVDTTVVATRLRDALTGLVTLHGNLTRELELMYNAILAGAIADLERRHALRLEEHENDYGKISAQVEELQRQRDEMVRSVRKLFLDDLALLTEFDETTTTTTTTTTTAAVTNDNVLDVDAAKATFVRLLGIVTRFEQDVASMEKMIAIEPSAAIFIGGGGLSNPLVGSADAIAATMSNIVGSMSSTFREKSEPLRRVRQLQVRTSEVLNRLREEEKRCERIYVTAKIAQSRDTQQHVRALTDYILRFRIAAQQERRSALLYESVRSEVRRTPPPKYMRWNVNFFDTLARRLIFPYLDDDGIATTLTGLEDSKRQLLALAISHIQCTRGYIATCLALGQAPNREVVTLLLKSIQLTAVYKYATEADVEADVSKRVKITADRVLAARSRLLDCVAEDDDGDKARVSALIRQNFASSSLQTRVIGFALACVVVPNYRQRFSLLPFR